MLNNNHNKTSTNITLSFTRLACVVTLCMSISTSCTSVPLFIFVPSPFFLCVNAYQYIFHHISSPPIFVPICVFVILFHRQPVVCQSLTYCRQMMSHRPDARQSPYRHHLTNLNHLCFCPYRLQVST